MIRDFDPATFPLEADLSRADVRLLYEHCRGRRVVEFGAGGSTVLLAQFAERVTSYDTDPSWTERTAARLNRDPVAGSRVTLNHCGEIPPADLPAADVYFIDGYVPHRADWVRAVVERRRAETILVHDSRSSAMSDMARALTWPLILSLRSLEYHAGGSNMLLIRCGAPCEWVNWNEAEPEHRLPFLS